MESTLQWLLGTDNPSVRYLTLLYLLERDPASAEVREAKSHLMDYAITREILAHGPESWFPEGNTFAKSYQKYHGRFGQMILLGQCSSPMATIHGLPRVWNRSWKVANSSTPEECSV